METTVVVLVTGPAHGALAINANGAFTYTPGLNFSGFDTFTYKDHDIVDSNVATVRIDVTATPLPGALPLFATGLGALGLLVWRRKRKQSVL
jgi:hypothetical protein